MQSGKHMNHGKAGCGKNDLITIVKNTTHTILKGMGRVLIFTGSLRVPVDYFLMINSG